MKGRRLPFWPFLLLGVGLLLTGVLLGQPEGVFRKAVNVCFECIGIG